MGFLDKWSFPGIHTNIFQYRTHDRVKHLFTLADKLSNAGMEIRHRQLAHGKLKMAWMSWGPYTARPGGPQDVFTKFGEGLSYSCKDMTNKNLTKTCHADVDNNTESIAATSSIPVFSQMKMVWYA